MIYPDIHSTLSSLPTVSGQVCVVADKAVLSGAVRLALGDLPVLELDIDEAHKSLETVTQIWDFLLSQRLTRRGTVVCLGGGVLTDLGGFAAATYKRGVPYINIPTTLLAMVDASTGGKTGFDYRGYKNSIGAFAPPLETRICPQWLETLPAWHMLSGFAEMLKTGLIDQTDSLWSNLLQYDLDTMTVDALAPLIEQCVAVKERIVAADPYEEGLRKVLNFGHTFGHALEEISLTGVAGLTVKRSYSETVLQRSGLLHGYAVMYGLIAEVYLSVVKSGCPKQVLQQLTQLMLHYYGKPQCNCSDRGRLIALMQQDKKNERAGEINCTLIQDVGSPVINRVITPEEADEALEYLFSL